MTVAVSRIKFPAENKIGMAIPRSKVTSLSGFGNLAGVNVASKKPSGYFNQNLVIHDKSCSNKDKEEVVIVTCKCRRN